MKPSKQKHRRVFDGLQNQQKKREFTKRNVGPISLLRVGVFLFVCLIISSLVGLGLFGARSVNATAGINQEMSFEGKIVTSAGLNIPDGTYNMEFRIYTGCTNEPTNSTGCTAVWTEDYLNNNSQGVTFTSGTYQVNLGSICAFTTSTCENNSNTAVDFNSYPLYLSLQIGNTSNCSAGNPGSALFTADCGGDGVMNPFVLLTSTPYAMNAGKLGGLTASQFGQLAANQTWTGTNTIQGSSSSMFQVQNSIGSNDLVVDTTGLTNSVTNPGFEGASNTGWALKAGSGTVGISSAQAYSGNSSEQVALTSTVSGDGVKFTPTSLSATTYVLSFYMKQTAGTAFGANLGVGYNNGADNSCTLTPSLAAQPVPTTGWARYYCAMTMTGSPTYIYWKQTDAPGSARTFYLDDVQLEQTSNTAPNEFTESRLQLNGTVSSPLILQSSSDSTTAFQIQNSAADSTQNNIFTADTLNGKAVFGNIVTNTTGVATQVLIQANTNNRGIAIESNGSQDALDIYKSDGTNVLGINPNGTILPATNNSVSLGSTSLNFAAANSRAYNFDGTAAGNLQFGTAATATGNALNITGQTAGSTANNGGAVTVKGGLATTTGTGGLLTLQGGATTSTGTNGGVSIDAGSGASTANGTISIGATNASTIGIGNTAAATQTTIQGGTGGSAIALTTGTNGSISLTASGTGATTVQGGTGGVAITTGAGSGTTGSISITTGNSSGGASGGITIDAGTNVPSGTQIENKTFESGVENMQSWFGTSSVVQSTAQAHGGTHSLAITDNAGFWAVYDYPTGVSVTAGHIYSFSAWVRGTAVETINAEVIWDPAFSEVVYQSAADTTTGWTHYSGTLVAPAGATSAAIEFGSGTGTGSATTYVDDVTITDLTTTTTPAINIGTANAEAVTIGNSNQTTATTLRGGAGGVNIVAGSAGAAVNIGTSNSNVVTIGDSSATGPLTLQGNGISQTVTGDATAPSDTIKTSTNSTAAFQVQNASSYNVLSVDTSGGAASLGTSSHVNGKLVLNNSTNNNTVAIISGVTSSGYTLTMPTALGASGGCLSDTTGTGVLGWATCAGGGGGGANTALSNLASVAINTDLQFDNTGNRTINIAATGASTAGRNLTVQAGNSGTGAVNGGNLVLQAGASGGSGTTGSVIVKANGTDSTTAFQVQDHSANALLTVDSTNQQITAGQNSTSVVTPTFNVVQSGTGDATMALQTASGSSTAFYIGNDTSNSNALTFNSNYSATYAGSPSSIGHSGGTVPDSNGTMVQGNEFTATATGTVTSMSVDFDGWTSGDKFSVGVYAADGTGGIPGTLLGHSGLQAIALPNGIGNHNVNTITLSSPASVTNGTGYWFVFNTDSANDEFLGTSSGSPGCWYSTQTISDGTWTNITSGQSQGPPNPGCTLNITATITPSGSLTDTNSNALFTLSKSGQLALRNVADSTTALQVQNASGNSIIGVDTSSGQMLLGTASALNAKIVFYNSTNSNTLTLAVGATAASTTIQIPSSMPATSVQQGASYAPFVTNLTGDTAATTSTTLADIVNTGNANDKLSFTIPAGKTFNFRASLIYTFAASGLNNSGKFGWVCSNASQSSTATGILAITTSTTIYGGTTTACTTTAAAIINGGTNTSAPGGFFPADFYGTIKANASSATTVTFEYADSNLSGTHTTTVKAGSYVQWWGQ